jgi:hypothetical protein
MRQDNDIIIILHIPCINVQELMTIYRHLPILIPLLQVLSNHDMTIRQSIENEKLSESNFEEIYNQSDEALFITDEHELIAIGKDNTKKVISQVVLASYVQRNHVYMFDKHQVLRNDLADTCLRVLYIRSKPEVQNHCRFERKITQELVY